jgi:serine/threonine protein kinase
MPLREDDKAALEEGEAAIPGRRPASEGDTQIDPQLAGAAPTERPSSVLAEPPRRPPPKKITGRLASADPPLRSSARQGGDGSYGDHDGDELDDRYVLRGVGEQKAPLGQGAFGEVWQAYDRKFEREVALKILKQRMCRPAVLLRFELEKQLIARMEHPNIAQVFEAGTLQDGRPFLAMELIRGYTLTEYCAHRRLSLQDRIRLFIPICRAVQHAHERFVLHRDLKPTNIMVVEHDGQPVPKVIDFGIAKVLEEGDFSADAGATLEGSIKGTPAYMSPEQTQRTEELTVRSDVYTLGAILFEMLTADTPLSHRRTRELDFFQLVGLICHEEPVPPSAALLKRDPQALAATYPPGCERAALARSLRGDLDTIVLRALQKEPTRRYGSAAELAEDLERHLAQKPIRARPASLRYRATKLFQRHRAAAVAGFIVMLALVVTGIVSTVSYFSVSSSLLREQIARQKAVAAEKAEAHQRQAAELARNVALQREADAREARDAAVLARQEAEDLINYMLFDLRQQLEPLGRSRLLASVSEKAEQYFAHQPVLAGGSLERNRAAMHYNRGYILLAQGDVPRAVAAFRAARSATEGLLKEKDNPERQLDFATASHGLGLALRATGQPEEARALFEEMLPVLRRLELQHDPMATRLLAATLEQVGELEQRAGHQSAAEACFLEQESRARALKAADPADTRNQLALAVACEKVGGALQRSGRVEQALAKVQEEVDLLRALAGQRLDDLVLRRNLAVALEKLGNLELALHRPESAKKHFEERLREAELLARVDPRRLDFRRDLAVAHERLSEALLALHDIGGARSHAESDLQLASVLAAEYPDDPAVQSDLAASKCQFGLLVLKSGRPSPARLAEARSSLDQAAQILRKSIGLGQIDERGKAVLAEVEKAIRELPAAQ